MNSSDIGVTGKGCMVTVCECAVALFKYVIKMWDLRCVTTLMLM